MQFVYGAINTKESSSKLKMSKWRHLQTLLVQIALLGLIFFVIMQNGDIRRQIQSKLSHQFVEDIFNEKIAQLSKQIEHVKLAIGQTKKWGNLQTQEIKMLIRILAKQIGLPMPLQMIENQIENQEKCKQKGGDFEVIEFQQEIEDRKQKQQFDNFDQDTDSDTDNDDLDQMDEEQDYFMNEDNEQDEPEGQCNKYEYILSPLFLGQNKKQSNFQQIGNTKYENKINISYSGSKKYFDAIKGEEQSDELLSIFELVCKLGLVIILTLGLLILIFLSVNRCRKLKNGWSQMLTHFNDHGRKVRKIHSSLSKI